MMKLYIYLFCSLLTLLVFNGSISAQMADCNDPGNYSIIPSSFQSYNELTNTYTIYPETEIIFMSEGVDPNASDDPLFTAPGLILGIYNCYPTTTNLNLDLCLIGSVPGVVNDGAFTFAELGAIAGSNYVIAPIINPDTLGNIILKSSCTGLNLDSGYPNFILVDPIDCEGFLNGPAQPGTTCDDESDCTIDDMWTSDCVCVGTIVDADSDGVCAADDCDDANPDLPTVVGSSCDDGMANTFEDVIQGDGCTCAGEPCTLTPISCDDLDPCTVDILDLEMCNCIYDPLPDMDGDGLCMATDCDDNNPDLPTIPGSTCDDNDPNTLNDLILADGCTCLGTTIIDPCADLGGDEDGDGVCGAEDCEPLNPLLPAPVGSNCDDNNPDTINDSIGLDGCTCTGILPSECEELGGDADNDGVCADYDCDDTNELIGAIQVVGTTCDDGDPLTQDDVIQSDGCTCAGKTIPSCADLGGDADKDGVCADYDCDDTNELIGAIQVAGTTCDDGDPLTQDDVIQSDGCTCAGTTIPNCTDLGGDADNDGVCADFDCDDSNELIGAIQVAGTTCDDGDPLTQDDVIQSDGCSCVGVPVTILCEDLFGNIGIVGSSCDDGYDCSVNDVFVEDCICIGTEIDIDDDGICSVEDCDDTDPNAGAPQAAGTSCNDNNANTTNDVILSDGCTCEGSLLPLCQEPWGTGYPGGACSDGDPCTTNDTITAECDCIGILIDIDNDGICNTSDCNDNDPSIGAPQLPGTACNDGNPNTENDMIAADGCSCIGVAIQCNTNAFAGIMPAEYYVCNGLSTVSIPAESTLVPMGYALGYILHTIPGSILGTTITTSTNGTVIFNNATMNTNTAYYLSCIVGPDANSDGFPDIGHTCTIVAPGTKLVWLNPITVEVNEYCDWAVTGDFYITFSFSGGYPQYQQGATYTVSGQANNVQVSYGQSLQVALGQYDGLTYTLTATDALGCTTTYDSDPVVCYKTPIELLTFHGKATNQGNLLQWATGSEYENDYFQLERSMDGIQFITIKTIDGAGTSNHQSDYQYMDAQPQEINYYRLKWVDYNGNTSTSEIIKIENNKEQLSIQNVYPVPASDEVIIELLGLMDELQLQLQLYDVAGKQVNIPSPSINNNTVHINISTLPNGVYFIRLSRDNQVLHHRFIKN